MPRRSDSVSLTCRAVKFVMMTRSSVPVAAECAAAAYGPTACGVSDTHVDALEDAEFPASKVKPTMQT
jgi:hypothetical protein